MNNICVKNLTVDFGEKRVLNNLSINIEEGSFVCILGKNGSGKSTFAKTLNGLILPTNGDVTIYGLNTKNDNDIIDIRKNIGMSFQNPDNQIVASIVEEDVAFALENIGIPTNEIRIRIDEAMKTLGIYDLKNNLTSKLSGGQKQKVSLAGILAMKSRIIVLDEPTTMIDKAQKIDLLNTIKKLNTENNITVILITHFIDEITFADRVLIFDEGNILLDDTPNNVLTNDEILNRCGFELPYITRIAKELKKHNMSFKGYETKVSDIVCQFFK